MQAAVARVVALTAALLACACGGSPTQPAATGASSVLQGKVTDTAFRPLAGVRVDVLSGPQTGRFAISNADGVLSLDGPLVGVQLRATKAGYLPATETLTADTVCPFCPSQFYLALESPDTPVHLEPGTYDLTLTADSACTRVPPALRTRTYTAAVTRGSRGYTGGFVVEVPGLLLLQNRFMIGISGHYLATDDGGYPTLFEQASPDTYVGIDFLIGTSAFQPLGASGFSLTFPGTFEFCTVTAGNAANFCDRFPPANVIATDRCFANSNTMVLTRR